MTKYQMLNFLFKNMFYPQTSTLFSINKIIIFEFKLIIYQYPLLVQSGYKKYIATNYR